MDQSGPESAKWRVPLTDAILLALYAAAVLGLVRGSGFSAISDDDYARLVIAQQFADAPSWDPSGSSWLPVPFLIVGSVLWATDASMQVALATQHTVTVLCTGALWLAARRLGCGRWGALLGPALALLVPTVAFSAAAFVPSYLTGALLVLAFSCQQGKRAPILGGLALLIASGSRYEAWPVSALYALFCFWDAYSGAGVDDRQQGTKSRNQLAGGLLALLFPCVWMLHGALRHDDALFFVRRVTEYKAALGGTLPDWVDVLRGYPRLLLVVEPEVTLLGVFVIGASWSRHPKEVRRSIARRAARPLCLLSVMLLALIVGDARGGAPTHHAERALLAFWMLLSLGLGLCLERLFDESDEPLGIFAAALVGALSSLGVRQSSDFFREGFANRHHEEVMGDFLAEIETDAPVALALPDYGYFAVMARAGRPSRFVVLESHDPRKTLSKRDPLRDWLGTSPHHCYFVTTRDRPGVLPRVLAVSDNLMLAQKLSCPKPAPQDLEWSSDLPHRATSL